ncbi:hypothetical protein GDO81_012509 [Engystomops pustulosus]|uniref:Uncharacterized protein n=1 Tax=Engystomops pustulosus TaxID=76066 RepID=A0AAV7BMR3_ENGPU|nr:hypothetical protein GDO81_012509 [Engystomops pustulosus]
MYRKSPDSSTHQGKGFYLNPPLKGKNTTRNTDQEMHRNRRTHVKSHVTLYQVSSFSTEQRVICSKKCIAYSIMYVTYIILYRV